MSRGRLGARTAAAVASILLASAAGCGDDDGGSAAEGGDKSLVGFINGSNVEYNVCLAKGLRAALGDDVELVELNSRDDVTAEVSNGEDLLARNPDALILQTVNVKSGTQIVNQANRQDVPILLSSVDFVRDPSKLSAAIVFNLMQRGMAIGGFLKEQIAAAGGEPATVAIIGGAPGAASDILVQGFRTGLKGAPAEVVFDQPAMWSRPKAAAVAENMIQAQPDLDYVFVANEDMAFGVLQSLETAGKADQIEILTSGGTDDGLEAVRDGTFRSTTDGSPYNIGELTGRATLDVIAGRAPDPKVEEVPSPVIAAENVDEAKPYCAPAGDAAAEQ
jgi:ribose transport system substrate-binding protein